MIIRFLGRFKPTGSPVRGSRTTREESGREVELEEGVVMVIEVGEKKEKVMITAESHSSHSDPSVSHQRSFTTPSTAHAASRNQEPDDSRSIPNNCFVNSTSQLYTFPTQLLSPNTLINGQRG